MNVQEIACPRCGKIVSVNILDKRGSTKNRCRYCKTLITISTDRHGNVKGIRGTPTLARQILDDIRGHS